MFFGAYQMNNRFNRLDLENFCQKVRFGSFSVHTRRFLTALTVWT